MRKRNVLILAFVSLLIARSVGHADPRKIDFTTKLTDFEGKVIEFCSETQQVGVLCPDDKVRQWTLGYLAVIGLSVQDPNEDGYEQVKRMALAQEIYKNSGATLDTKEINLICNSIAKFVNRSGQSGFLTYRAWQLLDPARIKK